MADPPWQERGGGKCKRGADAHYPLLHVSQIIGMGASIQPLVDHEQGCHLYLWTTNNFLVEGIEVMKAWGFDYITQITWAKRKMGLGQYFRGMTEPCLFGSTKKRPAYKKDSEGKRCQSTSLFFAEEAWEKARRHSEKPPSFYKMVEHISYGDRLEIFSRTPRVGWDVWGNEVDSELPIVVPERVYKSKKNSVKEKKEEIVLPLFGKTIDIH